MRITPAGHIEKMSGAHSRLVYHTRRGTGQVFAMNRNTDARKSTSEQKQIQEFLRAAARNWKNLTAAQRQAWLEYGKQYFTKDEEGRLVTVSGLATYARANTIRQILGLPLSTNAPVEAPPPAVLSFEAMDAQNPDALGLTIAHTIADTSNLSVLVRMTPRGTSVADNPADNAYYLVRGVNANSAQPLPVNGGNVVFTPTKFIVDNGNRYGVEVRVVRTTDGLVSAPKYGDFIKVV